MADQEPRSDTQIRINSRRGSTAVHPVAAEEGSIGRREIKQFKKWILWLIPSFVVANVVVFIVTMYVNDCPKNSVSCVARFLGRFSFQPLKENPLLGPSSST